MNGPGFLYYAWFPKISVFKVGRTISGLRRFQSTDYTKFFRQYGKYEYVNCVWLKEHYYTEKYIHREYKKQGFTVMKPKREYYYANSLSEYLYSKQIFDEYCYNANKKIIRDV
jgi:hypothetical protein